jgi:lysophospholipase L1-like esterase
MKKYYKIIIAFLILSSLVYLGCEDYSKITAPTFSTGSADFTRFVTIGNSLTAGYESSALFESGQMYSFGNLISQQVNTNFEQPWISDPGIGGQIQVVSLNPFTTTQQPADAGSPINLNYPAPYNNMGIPGIVLADVMTSTTTANSYSKSPFIDIVLRGQGTQFLQAKALQPTFITLWIGNNDVLGFATSGGVRPTEPTPSGTFAFLFNQLADSLAATGTKAVIANIPNVTAIPFFTTVGPGFAQTLINFGAPGFYYQKHGEYAGTVGVPAQLSSYSILLTLISQSYLGYFGQPSGKFYRDNNVDITPLIQLGILDTSKAFGVDPQNPIPDALVLDTDEILTAAQSTNDFNNAIAAAVNKYPSQFVLVDINTFFDNIKASDDAGGTEFNGIKFSTTFVSGGIFSLDGVHPTAQGYAIVANQFIKSINTKFGATIPLVDVSTIPGSLVFTGLSMGKYGIPKIPYDALNNLMF